MSDEIKNVINQTTDDVKSIIGGLLTEEDKQFANDIAKDIAEIGIYLSMGNDKEKAYAATAIKDLELGLKARIASTQIKATQAAQEVFSGAVTSLIRIFIALS